jgi:hypothetical protein
MAKNKQYTPKSGPTSFMLISEDSADAAEEVVKRAILAKTPMELADVFAGNSYLNGKMFYRALDLNEERAGSSRTSIATQSDIFTLAYLDHVKKNKLIDAADVDGVAKLILNSIK